MALSSAFLPNKSVGSHRLSGNTLVLQPLAVVRIDFSASYFQMLDLMFLAISSIASDHQSTGETRGLAGCRNSGTEKAN
jgi:hypothetical protein